jgi:hypothetical protein
MCGKTTFKIQHVTSNQNVNNNSNKHPKESSWYNKPIHGYLYKQQNIW